MGYLTTITIYNDSADQIKKHPRELAEKIDLACSGFQITRGRNFDGLGNAANILTLQKPRHADDHTLYLHAGNTVTDVYNAESELAIDTFISEMEYHLKRLKEKRLDNKIKKTISLL